MKALVDMIGEDAARQLARQFGGTRLYVPRTIGEHHPIAVTIGRIAAAKLLSDVGGQTIPVPRQPERRERVVILRGRGLTIAQIARETYYSERHVHRLLREHEDDRQPGLFGAE